jgi:hypothetical protein
MGNSLGGLIHIGYPPKFCYVMVVVIGIYSTRLLIFTSNVEEQDFGINFDGLTYLKQLLDILFNFIINFLWFE